MSTPKKIRTRFAPSPTGFLHVGGLRTALYSYLIAKQNKGEFILRIEDTDRQRLVENGIDNILKSLYWAGIIPDKGVKLNDKNEIIQEGKNGPYIQSERLAIYQKYAQELVGKGYAYYCFCSSERLEKIRQEQQKAGLPTGYDGHCLEISPFEAQKRAIQGEKYVIRLKMPKSGETSFFDLIRGQVSFQNKLIDDQVLIKSDGYPTYHLAVVVDDYLMGITHIVRGEEWLSSTPKHIQLYQYFGWPLPQYAHLPLLLNQDKSKLSKRQGDVAVDDYQKKGYLAEALINFIALLGWNPGDNREVFSLKELIKEFKIEKINKSGAIFNLEKLDWLNGNYIRQMGINELTEKCVPYLEEAKLIEKSTPNHVGFGVSMCHGWRMEKFKIINTGEVIDFDYLKKIVALEQERLKKLDEIGENTRFFFEELDYEPSLLIWKKSDKKHTIDNLSMLEDLFKEIKDKEFNKKNLEKILMPLAQDRGVGDVLWPLRVALTGRQASPGPFEVAEALGKEKVMKRIKYARNLLTAAHIPNF